MDLFLGRLRIIPSYFDINIIGITRAKMHSVLERSDFQKTNARLAMMHTNILSFLSFLFKDIPGCRDRNIWVLERYPQNINANTIKSVLLFQQGNFTEADECVEYLKQLSTDEFLMAEAKAEIANAYSRMGPNYIKSISFFEEAILNYQHIYEWKYRLGLTILRCQHQCVRLMLPSALNNKTKNFMKCKRIFEDILENANDADLKALASVKIATLYIWPYKDNVDFNELQIDTSDHMQYIVEHLDKARELSASNEQVLTETGRIWRQLGRFMDARLVLEYARNIHATGINCHNLALVLQKLGGTVAETVAYLEQAVELSQGFNYAATVDLAKAYLRLSRPEYSKALQCGTSLLESKDIIWMKQGCENNSKCYERMAYKRGISEAERIRLCGKADNMKRQTVIYNALAFTKSLFSDPQPKFTPRELFPEDFRGRWVFYDYKSPRDQLKRAISICNRRTVFMIDLQSASNSVDSLNEMIQQYLRLDKYQDCLDLVTILMATDLPNIVKIALDVMMEIVSLAIQKGDLGLASSCFRRGIMSFYNVEEVEAHVRLIYDRNSEDEADLIDGWLTDVGLTVTKNDEDIFAYMKREDALITALSSNIVMICIFKDNNCDLLDDYPVYLVTHDKPVLIPMIVNGSKISPAVNNHEPMIYPTTTDTKDKGLWLKTLGERMFQLNIEDDDGDVYIG